MRALLLSEAGLPCVAPLGAFVARIHGRETLVWNGPDNEPDVAVHEIFMQLGRQRGRKANARESSDHRSEEDEPQEQEEQEEAQEEAREEEEEAVAPEADAFLELCGLIADRDASSSSTTTSSSSSSSSGSEAPAAPVPRNEPEHVEEAGCHLLSTKQKQGGVSWQKKNLKAGVLRAWLLAWAILLLRVLVLQQAPHRFLAH